MRIKRLLLMATISFALSTTAFAHGGEDHGDSAPATATTSANMTVRTTRAGELEITLKHPPVEPDKQTAARIFLTRYATNEAIGGARLVVTLTNGSGAPVEAVAEAGNTLGMYQVTLPPVPGGEYQLGMRLEREGAVERVSYGALQVAFAPSSPAESESSWARTILLVLGALVLVGLIGFVAYRALQSARRNRRQVNEEAATA